jgi:FkbM family methyltransferase
MSFAKNVSRSRLLIIRSLRRVAFLPLVLLEWISLSYAMALAKISKERPNFWYERQSKKNDLVTSEIRHRNSSGECRLTLFTPNWLCWDRARTFSSKEPDTLAWIDEFGGTGAMFDIGANVGLYSLYHAKTKPGNVYAFEPSVFNLPILVKNIYKNQLQSKISVIPAPLSDRSEINNYRLTSCETGDANSAFGVDYGFDGAPFVVRGSECMYQVLGFSLDSLMRAKLIKEIPSMIKLDVDGIEHLILKGAEETLRHPDCRTVLVEAGKHFHAQWAGIDKVLSAAGFVIDSGRLENLVVDRSGNVNQIWKKERV